MIRTKFSDSGLEITREPLPTEHLDHCCAVSQAIIDQFYSDLVLVSQHQDDTQIAKCTKSLETAAIILRNCFNNIWRCTMCRLLMLLHSQLKLQLERMKSRKMVKMDAKITESMEYCCNTCNQLNSQVKPISDVIHELESNVTNDEWSNEDETEYIFRVVKKILNFNVKQLNLYQQSTKIGRPWLNGNNKSSENFSPLNDIYCNATGKITVLKIWLYVILNDNYNFDCKKLCLKYLNLVVKDAQHIVDVLNGGINVENKNNGNKMGANHQPRLSDVALQLCLIEPTDFKTAIFFGVFCDIFAHFGQLLQVLRKLDAWYLNEKLKYVHKDLKTNKNIQSILVEKHCNQFFTLKNSKNYMQFLNSNTVKNGKLFFIRHFDMITLIESLLNLCKNDLYFKLIIIAMLYNCWMKTKVNKSTQTEKMYKFIVSKHCDDFSIKNYDKFYYVCSTMHLEECLLDTIDNYVINPIWSLKNVVCRSGINPCVKKEWQNILNNNIELLKNLITALCIIYNDSNSNKLSRLFDLDCIGDKISSDVINQCQNLHILKFDRRQFIKSLSNSNSIDACDVCKEIYQSVSGLGMNRYRLHADHINKEIILPSANTVTSQQQSKNVKNQKNQENSDKRESEILVNMPLICTSIAESKLIIKLRLYLAILYFEKYDYNIRMNKKKWNDKKNRYYQSAIVDCCNLLTKNINSVINNRFERTSNKMSMDMFNYCLFDSNWR